MASITNIPDSQLVAYVENPGPEAHFVLSQAAVPELALNQVLVKLQVAGICHSDLNRVYGKLPLSERIVGHEGVGIVVKVGPNSSLDLLGKRVGLGWLSEACSECEICEEDYTSCPNQKNLGRNLPGTFQQYVAVSSTFVHMLPDELDASLATPLLCGKSGVTMLSAIRKANLKPNGWLLLPGAGGGLGHLGLQIAKAEGYRVIAVDTGDDKKAACIRFGATHFLDFKKDDVVKEVLGLTNNLGVNATICTAGSLGAYRQAADCVRHTGTLVCIGIHPGHLPASPFELVRRGLRVVGSAVGTTQDMQHLFQLAIQGKVTSLVKVVPFAEIDSVAKNVQNGLIAGRAVMTIPQ
ncbi:hypothetical protein FE257_001059 [Aspergillus nanangensis]|uniref:Enoyl reductase (ER) domain-containing protein n=1 Tax=Aspergillus nanangensis TaxID=2582783 RepID=A0AAD4CUD8_ASPNN|nr:hypothetical protein FE257_001059 [Aspergillus nanangensis]